MSSSTSTMSPSSLTPPPSILPQRVSWDVVLSFQGDESDDNDKCNTLGTSLYDTLRSKGVRVFTDKQGVGLEEAIIDSALAVAIISPSYAASAYCLDQLASIFRCKKRVVPVFFHVDPSDVRRQNGVVGDGFKALVASLEPSQSQVETWTNALIDVGLLSGETCYSKRDEEEVIKRILKQVVGELENTPVFVAKQPVGLDSRVDKVMEKLAIRSSGVRFLGIHGTPGIGKTTLAKAVFNKLAEHFKYRCFISNIREQLSKEDGVLNVHNQIIQDLSVGKVRLVERESDGKKSIKVKFNENRVLVVLDDVSEINQFESLGIIREWFEQGSRIIVTSRDKGVLHGFSCNDDELHEADKLSTSESLELLSIHALERRELTEALLGIAKEIVSLTDGLPLALEVFGSSLLNKSKSEWEDSLVKLRKIRPNKIQDVLKISYDALDDQEKTAFLDISCLLIQMNMKRGDVEDMLDGCGLKAELAIRNLVTKSLMKISGTNELWMHDQIKDMGKQIVIEESLDDLGKRSRLWDSDDIRNVLQHDKGTGAIHGIVLETRKPSNELTNERISWYYFRGNPSITTGFNYLVEKFKELTTKKEDDDEDDIQILYGKSFGKMSNLKLLQINYSNLRGSIKYMPSELRCLQWKGCPEKTLDEIPKELRFLDVSESNLQQLWPSGWPYGFLNKVAPNLAVLNLSYNPHLTALPNMSCHRLLKKLTLERCVGLTKIHDSVGNMGSLAYLNLKGCTSLVDFPRDITGMTGLKELILSDCYKFRGLPNDVRNMKSLIVLLLDGTAIVDLPNDMCYLTQLEVLSLNGCKGITQLPKWIESLSSLKEFSLNQTQLEVLPTSIGSLSSLEKLSLVHCSSLVTLPDSVEDLKSLTELRLTGIALQQLPASICMLSDLKVLSLGQCRSLSVLSASIGGLASITDLVLDNTSITHLPEEIGFLKFLSTLDINNCKLLAKLPEKIGDLTNLTTLWVLGAALKELPDSIGKLESLTWLNLNKCQELRKLPDSIGNLRSLCTFTMEETAVTCLPESFGMLENLRVFKMKKVQTPTQEECTEFIRVLPTTFCNLSHLQEFDAKWCRISGRIPDDFDKLSKLEILDLGYNSFDSLPSTMKGLCFLRKLILRHCEKLKSLPRLPSTLEELLCADCYALESISDLSNLCSLQELQLANCNRLADVPGLECLESLRRLFMGGCTASATVAKRRLSTVTMRNLNNLSVPGSEIPDWFSKKAVNFATRPNLAIENVIVAVVVSVDLQKLGDIYAKLPNIVGIQAQIHRQNMTIFSTTLILAGVPKTVEDQLYLCRFKDYHPLVSMLRDGDSIQMIQTAVAADGVELKKWGIFLVFENDDDRAGDVDFLPLPQQSVTRRLARFFLDQ